MLLTSCDNIPTDQLIHRHNDNSLLITEATMSKDYTTVTLMADVVEDLGDVDITDSTQVDITIKDSYCHLIPLLEGGAPTLLSISYMTPDFVEEAGLTTLALLDLSQSNQVMEKQKEYVKKLHTIFCHDNLYLAFMLPNGNVSQTIKATDYVINNYISPNSPLLQDIENNTNSKGNTSTNNQGNATANTIDDVPQKKHVLLYHSVSNMLYQLSGHTGTIFDDARKKALFIFSDGQVYDEVTNTPLDPQHFAMQERLINQSRNLPTNTSVFYVNLAGSNVSNTVKDNNMMRMLCMQSHGKFYSDVNWLNIYDDILSTFNIVDDEYRIVLRNPEGRVYLGSLRCLQISIYKKDTNELVAECNREYGIGSIHNPIIVGDKSYIPIYVSGLLIALLLITLAYIVLQFIMPYVRFRIFQNKYVVKYTGKNMSVQGKLVADTCYFCKAPFQVGDTIVAKCQHTMHEDCWYENDQHCPEHGKHCPEGSHFYDSLNILNPRNGSYLIKWIVPAILVSALAWVIMANSNHQPTLSLIEKVCDMLKDSKYRAGEEDMEGSPFWAVMNVSPRMYSLPLFGLYLAPLLTLLFASLAAYHRQWQYRLFDLLSRYVFVLITAVLLFMTEFIIVLVSDIYDGSALIDWIPWTLVTYLILRTSTIKTRIHDLHSRTMICVSLAMGITNGILWDLLGTYETKKEIILFIILFILYGVVLAITIARNLPPSEKYFLHVEGEIKEMDIALYKWLRQRPDAFVTIGRSADCQLQITWDASSDIAPVHATVRHEAGLPYIYATEGDVYIGQKVLIEGRKYRLHHGMSFRIGTTKFTFVEA